MESASLANHTLRYRRLSQKREETQLNIWFNRTCLKRNITPSYIEQQFTTRIKTNPTGNKHHFLKSRKILLRTEIRRQYNILNNINLDLKILFNTLNDKLSFLELDEFLKDCNEMVQYIGKRKRFRLKHKIARLLRLKRIENRNSIVNTGNQFDTHKFHDTVMNLSEVEFNRDELDLLQKGLKFNPTSTPDTKQFETFVAELDNILNLVKDNDVASDLTHTVNKYRKNNIVGKGSAIKNQYNKTLKSIKCKINDNNLFITKADKGNCIVMIDRNEYIDKVEDFLNCETFTKLKKNPSNQFIVKTKNIIKEHKDFLNLPILYGLPKIHKEEIPIRPVVSFINSPTYNLAKGINNILTSNFNTHSDHSIRNSADLIAKMTQDINTEKGILVSFDVCNLFTNVPIGETENIVKNLLNDSTWSDDLCSSFFSLLHLCLEQNFFKFNDNHYRQVEGLAMGSPLSGTMAEIFMKNFETRVFNELPEHSHYVKF